jgi:hypothetical protein
VFRDYDGRQRGPRAGCSSPSSADYYPRRAVETKHLAELAFDSAPDAGTDEWARLCECFRELIPTPKPEYAALIERLELAEGEPAQVAGELNKSRHNLKVRRHRARQALRERLEQTCPLSACALSTPAWTVPASAARLDRCRPARAPSVRRGGRRLCLTPYPGRLAGV